MNKHQQEQINRRLALLCGVDQQMLGWWDEYLAKKTEYRQCYHRETFTRLVVELQELTAKLDGFELADYCNDLNAMFKAERALQAKSQKLFDDYLREIYRIVDKATNNGEVGIEVLDPFDVMSLLWHKADSTLRATAMYAVLVNLPTE